MRFAAKIIYQNNSRKFYKFLRDFLLDKSRNSMPGKVARYDESIDSDTTNILNISSKF